MKEPLVSVVVPYYNTKKELFCACINSIFNQDYANKEIIVVDDGSKEIFANEADRIASQYKCVRVIHQQNGGEGAARNTGIAESNGTYLMFVDSDDGLTEGWISYAVDLALKYDAEIVAGRVTRVPSIPQEVTEKFKEGFTYISSESMWKIQRDSFYFVTKLVDDLDILDPGVCSKLFHRNCIQDVSFPIGIKLSSDQVYNHAMIRKAKGMVLCNRTSYYYVINNMSISHVYQPLAVDYMMKSMALIQPMVFDNKECIQGYQFRVLAEITEAIQYAYFSDNNKISFRDKVKGVSYAANHQLVAQVLSEVSINELPNDSWRIKAFLLKNKMSYAFVILKVISDIIDKFRK